MINKCVMLFSCTVGQRMEPVGIMTRTVVDGPALHTFGDTVGNLERYRFFVLDGIDKRVIGLFGKIFKHFLIVEHMFPVVALGAFLRNIDFDGFPVKRFFYNLKP